MSAPRKNADPVRRQVAATIREHGLIAPGQRVLCAVSGGADSVALLHLILSLGYPAAACHFEHGVRGRNSYRDLAFVQNLCRRWQVPLFIGHGDVPGYAAQAHLSLESAARALRYGFFERAMDHLNCSVCATAHQLNDQAETLLLRLCRGARDGLAGIPYRNGAYVRPLRDVTRAQILAYLQENGLSFLQDETNEDVSIPRNRVRKLILPQMEQINSAAVRNLCRTLEGAGRTQSRAAAGETLERAVLDGLSPEEAARAAYDFLTGLGARQVGAKQVRALLETRRTGASLDFSGLTVFFDGVRWRRIRPAAPQWEAPLGEGTLVLPGGRMTVQICAGRPESQKTGPFEQDLDLDKLPQGCTVRFRRPGDVIAPLGAGGSQKLKELFIDKKIPRDRRGSVPLVAFQSEVYWAAGVAASQKAAISADTKRFLHIKYSFEEDSP